MTSLATLHEQALSKYQSVKNRLDSHKEAISTGVMRLVSAAESAAGGAAAAAIDYYLGGSPTSGLATAMVGPVPAVAVAALAGSALAILGGRDEWTGHVAAFANGLGAASAYSETLQFLQGMNTAQTSNSAI
jgi:hypothetical protein